MLDLPMSAQLESCCARGELRCPPCPVGCAPLHRLCIRNAEGYRQRLAELVLRGMASEVLSCRVSSTAICVEVRHRGGCGGLGRRGGQPPALLGGSSQGQVLRL